VSPFSVGAIAVLAALLCQDRPAAGAPAAVKSPPQSRPASSPSPKSVAGLLDRAKKEPAFVKKDFENALVALGAACLPDLAARLAEEGTEPWAVPMARAVGRLAGKDAAALLAPLMSSPSVDARAAAAEGLGRVVHASTLEALWPIALDERAVAWRAAQEAYLSLDKADPKLGVRKFLEGKLDVREKLPTRTRAVMTLSQLSSPESERVLAKGLSDRETDIRSACAEALGRMPSSGQRTRDDLVRLLEDRELEVRRQAILAVGRLRERAAIPRLLEYLEDDDKGLAGNAHYALKRISGYSFPSSPERWKEWWKRESAREDSDQR
jgi:HEAT repeat protein